MFTSTELFEHMQKYAHGVFSERLKTEGFSSYKGQDIHWYRLVNNEVIQTVHLVAMHQAPGTFAQIKYGCYPLFVPAVFQKSPLMNAPEDYVQASDIIPDSTKDGFESLLLYTLYNNRPYRMPDSLIMCCPEQNDGLDVLEKLLPVLDQSTTSAACYELHKLLRQLQGYTDCQGIASPHFVDEVLFWEDEKLYPYCKEYVDRKTLALNTTIKNGFSIPKIYKADWEKCKVLSQVFDDGNFEEYVNTFSERENQNLRLLERHVGIKGTV